MIKTFFFITVFLLIASPLTAGEGKAVEYLRQGTAHFEAQDYPRAIKAFGQAVRINPGNADAHKGMGRAYLKLGSSDTSTNPEMIGNALAAFKEALRIDPDSVETRYQLGLVYLLLYDKNGAIKEYEALKGLDAGMAEQLRSCIGRYRQPISFRTDGANEGAGGNLTRVTITGNQVLVPVTLSHGDRTVEATLILDTGASITLINREIAERLNINLDRAGRGRIHVVGGGVVLAWHARLERVSVGPHGKTGIDVAVVQSGGALGSDGLLGMNFLRNFKYSIDFTNQVINWAHL